MYHPSNPLCIEIETKIESVWLVLRSPRLYLPSRGATRPIEHGRKWHRKKALQIMRPETNLFLDVFEHIDGFAHESLVDDTEHFGLLEDLATNVEWQVFTVDDASHESQPSRHQLLKLVVDEYPLYVQLHGLALLVEHIPIQLKGHL